MMVTQTCFSLNWNPPRKDDSYIGFITLAKSERYPQLLTSSLFLAGIVALTYSLTLLENNILAIASLSIWTFQSNTQDRAGAVIGGLMPQVAVFIAGQPLGEESLPVALTILSTTMLAYSLRLQTNIRTRHNEACPSQRIESISHNALIGLFYNSMLMMIVLPSVVFP